MIKVPSNVSNFVVERTKVSYGVNLLPKDDSISMSAGIAFFFAPGLEYDVHTTIDKCYFTGNIARYAAHLLFGIMSSSSILVKDSNFTHANRLTEGDPMELVAVVQPDLGTLILTTIGTFSKLVLGVKQLYLTENACFLLSTTFSKSHVADCAKG